MREAQREAANLWTWLPSVHSAKGYWRMAQPERPGRRAWPHHMV